MVTMSEVARAAGVSRATASYALRGDPRIAADTAQKVFDAAKRLNYTANLSARSLRSGRSGLIGVAVYELKQIYHGEVSDAISRAATRHGMQAIVQQTSNSQENEISILRKVTSQLCDGMILSPGHIPDEEMKALAGGKPIVILDDTSLSPLFDSVQTPCEDGVEAAVQHLFDVGCRHVAVLGGTYDALAEDRLAMQVQTRRTAAALKAFEGAGISTDGSNFIDIPWGYEDACRAIHQFVDSGRPLDGVFCMTDAMAIGAMHGLAQCRLRVPDDVAVMGFDGIQPGAFLPTSLSTVAIDKNDMAEKAIGLLMRRLDNPECDLPIKKLTARFTIIQRGSTRR